MSHAFSLQMDRIMIVRELIGLIISQKFPIILWYFREYYDIIATEKVPQRRLCRE